MTEEQQILSIVQELTGSPVIAEVYYNRVLVEYDKSPKELVEEGRADVVFKHIAMLVDGVYE